MLCSDVLKVKQKYNKGLAANLLLSPTVKQFWKFVNICQSYAKDKSDMFFRLTVYMCIELKTSWRK